MTIDIVRSLEIDQVGEGRFRALNADTETDRPVFGGQLLGQFIVAASLVHPDKAVRTVQTVFTRTGRLDQPLDIAVETVHRGSTMATTSVSIAQGERVVARSQVLLDIEERDLVRHGSVAPETGGPEAAVPADFPIHKGSELRFVGGVDLETSAATGPAELNSWVRWADVPSDNLAVNQAFVSWYTDSLFIGAALRPHDGVGGSDAHERVSTGVFTHSLFFHEPVQAADWHLLVEEVPYAGHGRIFGQGKVFAKSGELVASFVQDAMVRHFPERHEPRGGSVVM